jgi:hypothetical protein
MAKKLIILVILCSVALIIVPHTTRAFQLVPCGITKDADGNITDQCKFEDLVFLIVRLINYLISFAAIVAMYHILLAGFNLVTAMGNEEKIKKSKEGITHAVVGFAIVILAFVFVNLLVNGIFGKPGAERKWWDPACVYGIADANKCLGGIIGPSS